MLSFGQIVVIILVALVVLGPQKTHKLVREVGRWVGRSRAYLRNLTEELERESGTSEAFKELRELRNQAGELRKNVVNLEREMTDVTRKINEVADAKDEQAGPKPAPAETDAPAAEPTEAKPKVRAIGPGRVTGPHAVKSGDASQRGG
ncbi:MAG TPA: twin-arginine translocase TatA/TatE family subunit [Nevskiaceae bacterium]